MRKIFLIAVFSIFAIAANAQKNAKIEILEFHAKHRCPTCKAIEKNTRETLDTFFAKQVKNGTVVLKMINVDEDANKAIAEQYAVFCAALFVNKVVDGKTSKNDMTNFAFENALSHPEAFKKGMKEKIEELLR